MKWTRCKGAPKARLVGSHRSFLRKGIPSNGVTVFLCLHGFQELVNANELLARRSSYLQGHVCVEGRGGHISEVVCPTLVMLFGLVAESARIRPTSQAPQPALANPHDPETGTPKHMFTASFQNQCITESLNNGFFETLNPGVLEAQNHPSQTLRRNFLI